LHRATRGNGAALDEVLPIVYDELRALAASHLRRERPGHSLCPTALVHETYARLKGHDRARWKNRAHFFASVAQTMRRVLVDHARARAAAKRGNGQAHLPLDEVREPAPEKSSWAELLDLDRALTNLDRSYPRCARVVELLFFGGLTASEAAEQLDVTVRTVERDWAFGRAWLLRALGGRHPS